MQASKLIRIYVTDDDQDDREILITAIKEANLGACIRYATSCKELLQLQNQSDLPDIIFLDINMPFDNGKICLAKIRADRRFDSVPIAMLTTSSSDTDILETYQLGANLYIVKPSTIREYVAMLYQVFLGNRKAQLIDQTYEQYLFNPDLKNDSLIDTI